MSMTGLARPRLASLKITLWEGCSNTWDKDTKAMGKMFLPLKGRLDGTEVEFVGFSRELEDAARAAFVEGPSGE